MEHPTGRVSAERLGQANRLALCGCQMPPLYFTLPLPRAVVPSVTYETSTWVLYLVQQKDRQRWQVRW